MFSWCLSNYFSSLLKCASLWLSCFFTCYLYGCCRVASCVVALLYLAIYHTHCSATQAYNLTSVFVFPVSEMCTFCFLVSLRILCHNLKMNLLGVIRFALIDFWWFAMLVQLFPHLFSFHVLVMLSFTFSSCTMLLFCSVVLCCVFFRFVLEMCISKHNSLKL